MLTTSQYLLIASIAVMLLCFTRVVWVSFQRDESALGVLMLTFTLVCGAGFVGAYILGWTRSRSWRLQWTMVLWSLGIVLAIGSNAYIFQKTRPEPIKDKGRSIPKLEWEDPGQTGSN